MSTLDSMLNSASTIFTMDIYRRHLKPEASDESLVKVGRVATGVLVVAGCLLAPLPGRFEGVFRYIQLVWGFISPAVVTVFFVGLFWRRATHAAAVTALLLGVPTYGLLLWLFPDVAFLNHMAITFLVLIVAMGLITWARPLAEPFRFTATSEIALEPHPWAKPLGWAVVLATVLLYIRFW